MTGLPRHNGSARSADPEKARPHGGGQLESAAAQRRLTEMLEHTGHLGVLVWAVDPVEATARHVAAVRSYAWAQYGWRP